MLSLPRTYNDILSDTEYHKCTLDGTELLSWGHPQNIWAIWSQMVENLESTGKKNI
jgi:hypothetical protein